jgi:hypothetical protein
LPPSPPCLAERSPAPQTPHTACGQTLTLPAAAAARLFPCRLLQLCRPSHQQTAAAATGSSYGSRGAGAASARAAAAAGMATCILIWHLQGQHTNGFLLLSLLCVGAPSCHCCSTLLHLHCIARPRPLISIAAIVVLIRAAGHGTAGNWCVPRGTPPLVCRLLHSPPCTAMCQGPAQQHSPHLHQE